MKNKNLKIILGLGISLIVFGVLLLILNYPPGEKSEFNIDESENISREYLQSLDLYTFLNGNNLELVESKSLGEGKYSFVYRFMIDSQNNSETRDLVQVDFTVFKGEVVETDYSENLILSKTVCTKNQRDIDFCTMEYNPVCGSDGKTYSNPCSACRNSGVEFYFDGEC